MNFMPPRVARLGRTSAHGFTLIELLIVVAIVAILARIALPAYFDSVRKSRRSDAVTAVAQIQQAQERYRANSSSYGNRFAIATSGGTLSSVALSTDTPPTGTTLNTSYTTPSGYYTLTFSGTPDGTSYSIVAQAQGSQANDTNCRYMQIDVAAGNIKYKSGPTSSTTENSQCWKK